MSHNPADRDAKLIRMANQIATFFESKPHDLGVAGVAEHINKFWEPRMRGHFFQIFDAGGEGFKPLVLEAAETIRRPGEPVSAEQAVQANAGVPGDKGEAAGETKSRIAASQG
ncbi:MAG: formate dehydrogenase subunit delta [Aliihoeflea sp.]|jgi:formate dehydrogenase subunit delta